MLIVAVTALASETDTAIWADDDALYGRQVLALHEGSWAWTYQFADIDPEGEWLPYGRGDTIDGNRYPYIRHPAYAAALAAVTSVFGIGFGFLLVSMLGFLAAAAVAWLLANEIEPRAGPFGFWLVAVSPLFANAYFPWAHTTSAALAGVTLVLVTRIVRSGPSPLRLGALAVSLFANMLIRSEAVLFAVAVLLALVAAHAYQLREQRAAWRRDLDKLTARERRQGIIPPRPGRALYRAAASAAAVVVAAIVAALVVEQRMVAAITDRGGGPVKATGPAGVHTRARTGFEDIPQYVSDQFHALWTVTFSPSRHSVAAALPVIGVVIVLLAVVGQWRRISRAGGRRPLAILAVAALAVAALYGWRLYVDPRDPVMGLLAAWPVVLIAFFVVPWRRTLLTERTILATVALFALAVYVTQYPEGGGAEWGGRFLSPTVVGLGAVMAAGLHRRWTALAAVTPAPALLGARILTAVLMAGSAIGGPWTLGTWHREIRPLIDAVDEVAAPTIAIASSNRILWMFPEWAWRFEAEGRDFLRTGPNGTKMLDALYEGGYDEVTLIASARSKWTSRYEHEDDVTPPDLAVDGVRIVNLRR